MTEKDGWNSLFIENHDNPRSVSRYVSDKPSDRVRGAKLLALMQTTLSGTLYVFQGEELGMTNFPLSWEPSEYLDIESQNYWTKMNRMYPNNEDGMLDYARKILQMKARDHSRTPVHWTAGPNAGFCKDGVRPWMRINDNYTEINAETQLEDKNSVLAFWRNQLQLRKEFKNVFVYGNFELVGADYEVIFAYRRWSESDAWLVVLNFSGAAVYWEIPHDVRVKEWVTSSGGDLNAKPLSGGLELEAWEGLLGRLT